MCTSGKKGYKQSKTYSSEALRPWLSTGEFQHIANASLSSKAAQCWWESKIFVFENFTTALKGIVLPLSERSDKHSISWIWLNCVQNFVWLNISEVVFWMLFQRTWNFTGLSVILLSLLRELFTSLPMFSYGWQRPKKLGHFTVCWFVERSNTELEFCKEFLL